MLPKVASHLSRAAAALHSQSNQTLRNVLQTPSGANAGGIGWAGPGPSSSSWGSHAGAGGAKFNAGSRFYSNFTNTGRTLVQANSSSHDGTTNQSDDVEENRKRVKPTSFTSSQPSTLVRQRHRSNSFSLSATNNGREERGETLGVLKVVQMHARFRHALAAGQNSPLAIEEVDASPGTVKASPVPGTIHVRRNSTSVDASAHSPTPFSVGGEALLGTQNPHASSVVDPATPQSVREPLPPTPPPSDHAHDRPTKATQPNLGRLESADRAVVLAEINRYRQQSEPSTRGYADCIDAQIRLRRPSEPVSEILALYNELLDCGLTPSLRVYKQLITALTDRDHEIQALIQHLRLREAHASDPSSQDIIRQQITALEREDNFTPALALFNAATALNLPSSFSILVYNNLLRCASHRKRIDLAIKLYGHLERSKTTKPSAITFYHLISVYANARQLGGAQEVFAEFRRASSMGALQWPRLNKDSEAASDIKDDEASRSYEAKAAQIMVWDKMVNTYILCDRPQDALALLESMMDSKAGLDFQVSDVPPPASSTFTAVIHGFCEIGDLETAKTWFDRLLGQNSPPLQVYQPVLVPTQPDDKAWQTMLLALVKHNQVEELCALYRRMLESTTRNPLRIMEREVIVSFFASALEDQGTSATLTDDILSVLPHLATSVSQLQSSERTRVWNVIETLVLGGRVDEGLALAESLTASALKYLREGEASGSLSSSHVLRRMDDFKKVVLVLMQRLFDMPGYECGLAVTLEQAARIMQVADAVGIKPDWFKSAYFLNIYTAHTAAAPNRLVPLSQSNWRSVANAFTAVYNNDVPNRSPLPFPLPDLEVLLDDLAANNVRPYEDLGYPVASRVVHTLVRCRGPEVARLALERRGQHFAALWSLVPESSYHTTPTQDAQVTSPPLPVSPSPPPAQGSVRVEINQYHSRFVDEHYPSHPIITPQIAYSRFEAGLSRGLYPSTEVIGRLINALGRLGELEKVKSLYAAAQKVLLALEGEKQWQSLSWFHIEDSMIVAFAHAGQLEASSVHRARIIEYGGSPSPDAYGAIISSIKDTTDDATVALAIFEESQRLGVRPNIFLYNTIISKLAKARKADYAIELFQQMKASGLRPTSVTYGAVIGACCRVADAPSAELLFEEMSSQPNFRPRVPPYNTMMQLYAQTKPDRDRVLYYYNAMLAAGVKPTAHTYKLLLDCYGSIQPVDFASMEEVFQRLVNDNRVQLSGTHWAALINGYGCVGKDLDKAVRVFDSIATHPKTATSPVSLPDPVAYEALINVFVHHHRTDLIPPYLDMLSNSNVHMTAYIVNLLIKGYAADGNLEKAREVFESLQDPPQGVAAPHNHAPHETSSMPTPISAGVPVYREPSTWEAMVRAELGAGGRDRALALVDRMEARLFPDAVTLRIRGILHDDPLPISEDIA